MDAFDEMIKREHQRLNVFSDKYRNAQLHHITSVRNAIRIMDEGIKANLSIGSVYGIWCFNDLQVNDIITPGFPMVSHRYIIARGLMLPVYVDFIISKNGIIGELEPDFDIGYLAVNAPRYQIKKQECIEPQYLIFNGLYEGNPKHTPGESCLAETDDIPREYLKDFLQSISEQTIETFRDVHKYV